MFLHRDHLGMIGCLGLSMLLVFTLWVTSSGSIQQREISASEPSAALA